MNRQAFVGARTRNRDRRWLEGALASGLLVLALLLYGINLDGVPLRDWDEGTIAQVAREIWQAPEGSLRWLYPTLWGEPYLNKPPLLHDAIALSYRLAGEASARAARLPGALLSALSVPLLYAVGRELFPVRREPALFAALAFLTLPAIARHGRLAMLDGALTCFAILTLLCVLKARRDLRWSLGVGLGISLMALTKSIAGIAIAGILGAFLLWDTPRLLQSTFFWFGLILGCLPGGAWYAAQAVRDAEALVGGTLFDQALRRIVEPVDGHAGPPWFYLVELLESLPWLLFGVWGLALAWRDRHWGWAKLVLCWCGLYWLAITLMATKLPWYVLPLYPGLALAVGALLAEPQPAEKAYPRAWTLALVGVALAALAGCWHYALADDAGLALVLAAVSLTHGTTAAAIARRDAMFRVVLAWGMYVSLVLLFCTPQWVWELNEAPPVEPIAAAVRWTVPSDAPVYTSFAYERPSLNFYSERRVRPASDADLRELWQTRPDVRLLVDLPTLSRLGLEAPIAATGALCDEYSQPQWLLLSHPAHDTGGTAAEAIASTCTSAARPPV